MENEKFNNMTQDEKLVWAKEKINELHNAMNPKIDEDSPLRFLINEDYKQALIQTLFATKDQTQALNDVMSVIKIILRSKVGHSLTEEYSTLIKEDLEKRLKLYNAYKALT